METSLGSIVVELYPDKAPLSAGNFLQLVDDSIYRDAVFYRVVRMDNQPNSQVKIQVIQGGLFHEESMDSLDPIAHESTRITGILHRDGVISMARLDPGSASSEFFICVGDQPSLDFGGKRNPDGQGFAAFGRVIEGMEVVRAIQALPDEGQYLVEHLPIRRIYRLP